MLRKEQFYDGKSSQKKPATEQNLTCTQLRRSDTNRERFRKMQKSTLKDKSIIPLHKLEEANKELANTIKERVLTKNTVEEMYTRLEESVREINKKWGEKRPVVKTDDKLTKETKQLIKARNELILKKDKNTREKLELILARKKVRSQIREDIKRYEERQIEEILQESGSTKKVKNTLFKDKYLVTKLKSATNKELYKRKDIVDDATEFYKQLYDSNSEVKGQRESKYNGQEEKEIPKILKTEIERAIAQLKKSKTPGIDKIENETIKNFKDTLIKPLTVIFNKILEEEKIPTQWNLAEIILLHKKGDRREIKNYRPISLISNFSKLFTNIIKGRLYQQLDENQSREQAGFRKDHSTVDQIFILNQLVEKSKEYNIEMHFLFLDFQKAFDMVEHKYLWKAMENQGVDKKIISIISSMYNEAEARVRMDTVGNKFKIKRGVRQGDPLSPNLFNCLLEEVFRQLDWERRGIKINGEFLNHLRFADDVVLLTEKIEELKIMSEEIREKSEEAGLIINKEKTILLSSCWGAKLELGGQIIEGKEETSYLGQIISFKDRRGKEITSRIKKGWKKFWSLKEIYKGKISKTLKIKTWEKCSLPVLTYGAQTWALTKSNLDRLKTTQLAMERSLLGVRRKDRIRNEVIREKTGMIDIRYMVKKLKMKYAGHVCRREGRRWERKVEEWVPYDKKRSKGRPVTRWRDEIRKEFGPLWRRLTWEKSKWAKRGEAYAQKWAGVEGGRGHLTQ